MTETETNPLGNLEQLQSQITRLELKIQALKERLTSLVTSYEEQDAERRVDITLLSNQNSELQQKVQELEESVKTTKEKQED